MLWSFVPVAVLLSLTPGPQFIPAGAPVLPYTLSMAGS